MIVRIVTYDAESMNAAREWHRHRAEDIEEIVGLERVDFIRQGKTSRAGAIMYFESPEDLRAYKASARYERLWQSIQEDWAAEAEPAQDDVYRLMEPTASRVGEDGEAA